MRASSLLQSAAVGLSALGQFQAHGSNINDPGESFFPVIEKVAACAQVDLGTNPCLVSAAVALAASGTVTPSDSGSGGGGPYHSLSESVVCKRPEVDESYIQDLVVAAKEHCVTEGQAIDESEVNQTMAALERVFIGSEECWNSVCSVPVANVEDQVFDELTPVVDAVVDLLSDKVAPCAGVELDQESCLVLTAVELIMTESVSGMVGMRRFLKEMEGEYSVSGLGFCSPPQVDSATMYHLLTVAQQKCLENGYNISTQEVEKTTQNMTGLFEAEECWTAMCDTLVDVEIPDVPALVFEQLSTCAEVELDPESCLVSTALDMLFAEAVAGAGGLQVRRVLYEEEEVGSDLCGPPSIDQATVHSVMTAAQQKCADMGVTVDALEVNTTSTAIVALLEAERCWNALCSEVEAKQNDVANMFTMHIMEYVTSCAEIELNEESCLESSLVTMLLSPDAPDGLAMRSRYLLQAHSTATRNLNEAYHGGEFGNEEMKGTYNEYGEFGQGDHYNYTNKEHEECGPPMADEEAFEYMVAMAREKCMARGFVVEEKDIQETHAKFAKLMGADQCWQSLCAEDMGGMIMGQYLEQCASIDLPFAMLNPEVVRESPESYVHDIKVTCMLNYVMSTAPSDFGLPNPQENSAEMCYPPGHAEMEYICPAVIGPAALKHCDVDIPDLPDIPDFPDLPDYPEEPMSFDYEMSMSYVYEWPGMDWTFSLDPEYPSGDHKDPEYPFGDHKDNPFDHEVEWPDMDWGFSLDPEFSMDYGGGGKGEEESKRDQEEDEKAVEHLCHILSQLSSAKGKACLAPLCETDSPENEEDFKIYKSAAPTATPQTFSPTSIPGTNMPSIPPTAPPVSSPTSMPSAAEIVASDPTAAPVTLSPTATPENGVVEVKFEAEITLNGLNISDIPTGGEELEVMVSVLKDVLAQFLPAGAEARILSIGGIRVSRRQRQLRILETDGVDVEFEVTVKQECIDADCSNSADLSNELYEDITGELGEAVSSGNLTTTLQEKAAEKGVPALEKAAVKEDSFTASEPVTSIRIVQNEDDDDDDISGALGVTINFPSLSIALLASVVLHFCYI